MKEIKLSSYFSMVSFFSLLLLLKMIFNVIDQSESDGAIKKAALSVVYDYLYKSAFVMDQEINAYACLIELDTMTN